MSAGVVALTLDEIDAAFESLRRLDNIDMRWYPLHYRLGEYRFPKLVSQDIHSSDKVCMIGAGIHGNEIAGPLTLARYGKTIIERAHSKGIKVIIYQLRNPSGYGRKRYNIDSADDAEEIGNDDFLRYHLRDGRIVDDLKESDAVASWVWSSDPRLGIRLPPETRLMHDLLRQDPLRQTRAVIDLHQDYISDQARPLAYHYAFGDVATYQPIVREIEKIVPVWRHHSIGAGYRGTTEEGKVTLNARERSIESDATGFIVRHDGTWIDLMYRLGESQGRRIHCITPETTGVTSLEVACEVNLKWIYGILDLVEMKN
jgi:hypothetical protein